MAEIPGSLDLTPLSGATEAGDAGVQPTDFGLDRFGAALSDAANVAFRAKIQQVRAQAQADRQAVQPDLLKLEAANRDQAATDAAQWNGQPGFAADQIAKARDRAQRFADNNQNYTPGQRAEFQRAANEQITQFGGAVINHEASVIGQNAADQAAVPMNAATTNVITGYTAAKQALLDNYDGSTKGLTTAGLAAFDQSVAAAAPSVPPALLPGWQAKMNAMRVEQAAQLSEVEAKGADAYVYKNGLAQGDALINTITSNPLAYDDVVKNGLPAIVATMPAAMAGMKKDLLQSLTGLAAQARVKGLIANDQPGQAVAELNDGRYDAVLPSPVKEELLARAQAENRASGPAADAKALADLNLTQRADAETFARLNAGHSTGQVNLDEIAAQLGPTAYAKYATEWKNADQQFATVGAVRQMPLGQLQAAISAPQPKPTDPNYASAIVQWQNTKQAAENEIKARANPGQWAFQSQPKTATRGVGAAAAGPAQDQGAMLSSQWQAVGAATDAQSRAAAARTFASSMLGTQAAAGVAPGARQILPQPQVAALAAGVINAPAEQKLAAMQSLAALVDAMPAQIRMSDGSTAGPQALLSKQLLAAHMSPVELSAIVDFGNDPAKLGRYVAALNDPTLKSAMPHGQAAQLSSQVKSALQPFLTSIQPLPGAQDLAQARIDRTVLIARGLMAHQNMNPTDAARTAAGDMTNGYAYSGTWRMPTALAGGWGVVGNGNVAMGDLGLNTARSGAAAVLASLTANNGAGLYAPSGNPGQPADQRKLFAAQIHQAGQWVTQPDDSGLMLMVPKQDGSWQPVPDKFGRPVAATWDQLKAVANGQPSPFAAPPPNAVHAPDGAPLPAVSKQAAFSALSWAVNGQESGFRSGQVSAKGALGTMQVTPDTVRTYAPRLGLPVDLDRAQNDDDYNRRIGNAALQDQINHFGSGAGVGLALAAYNAGQGRLEGYTDPKTNQWHPGWLSTIGDPRTGRISLTDFVSRIPYPETRAYVQSVLPAALARLKARH